MGLHKAAGAPLFLTSDFLFHFLIDFSSLFLLSAIQLFYSVRNMFELYSNVVPTYHQQHLVSKSSLNH